MRKTRYLTFGIGLLMSANLWAVKAKPGLVDFTQPDGSTIRVMLHGDESCHYATDGTGRLMTVNREGYLEYTPAEVSVKSIIAESNAGKNGVRRGSARYKYSVSAFPTIGEPHSLVILVEYPDHGFNVENPKEYFEEFLNGDNFLKDGATGSCKKFYSENSFGAFVPTFDVYGPVMLKNPRRYYGGGMEINANQMVVEAVEALDPEIDFSQYDHNDDGYVDSIYIIYSDKGEADGGPAESVWPFSWELEEEEIFLSADGVKFNTYGCSNELKNNGNMEGIGTFTHEFGHVLGLPDLYNTNSSYDISTPCDWSLMDSGSYNNDSRTPCNLSSFERYALGWLNADELVASGEYSLGNLSESNNAFIMTTEENVDEFYIAEYRLKKGWDEYLPAEGMLVWHIEFNQNAWDENTVNNNSKHHYVRLVRADNDTGSSQSSLSGDPFPGSQNVIEFSNSSEPSLKSWAGNDLNVLSITDIREIESDERVYMSVTVNEYRGSAGVEEITGDPQIKVEGFTISVTEGSFTVYDLSGRKVGTVSVSQPLVLSRGIYIVNGKKIII